MRRALTAAFSDDYVRRPRHAKRRLTTPERHVTYPSATADVGPSDHARPAADDVIKRRGHVTSWSPTSRCVNVMRQGVVDERVRACLHPTTCSFTVVTSWVPGAIRPHVLPLELGLPDFPRRNTGDFCPSIHPSPVGPMCRYIIPRMLPSGNKFHTSTEHC